MNMYGEMYGALADNVDALEATNGRELQLRDELVLHRAVAKGALQDYNEALMVQQTARAAHAAQPSPTTQREVEKANTLVGLTQAMFIGALRDVRACAMDAARVEFMGEGKYTEQSVRQLLFSVAEELREICGDENAHVARQLEDAIRQRLRVVEVTGTVITPDADVAAMDDSIPLLPLHEDERGSNGSSNGSNGHNTNGYL